MKRITYLFFLFFLLQHASDLKAQENHKLSEATLPDQGNIFPQSDEILNPETCFYYDKIAANNSSQMDDDYFLENLTRQIWDQTSSDWVNDSLYEHSYNDKNFVDTIIAHKWRNGSVWGNDLRTTCNYNTGGKLIIKSFSHWNTTNWLEYFKYCYSYSGSNQNLSRMDYYWYSDNTWILYGYYIYSWNSNNYLSNVIEYTLSTIGPWIYEPTWKDEYYYDSTNVLIMKTGFDAWGGWLPEINDLYFYDNIGNKTENIRQEWNSTDSIWINDYRYLYEYDINNVLLSIVYQDWQQDSLNWKNVWRETYTYTPQNKIATMFKETWALETGWNNYVLRTYFYDANYNWIERITFLWDETNWKNYYRHLATWLEPVSVEEEQLISNSYYLFNNYPNPFNPLTKIKFQVPNSEIISLKIYDVLANVIATLVNEEKPAGEYEVEFNGKGLPSGIYFYTLEAGNFTQTNKMILLK